MKRSVIAGRALVTLTTLTIALSALSFAPLNASEEKLATTPTTRMGTVTYETGFDFADYDDIRDNYSTNGHFRSWGEHPIIWKHIINPGIAFDPVTIDPQTGIELFQGVPEDLDINSGDHVFLNNYESGGAFTVGGNTVDPTGHWIETNTIDGAEAAILAAMAIWEWNSPVYLNYEHNPASGQVTSQVGIIDSVTLSVPSGVPHEVCGWDDPDPSTTCPGLVIESVKMTFYSDACLCGNSGVDYYDGPPVSGAEFVTTYESSNDAGPVIWDPPTSFSPSETTPSQFEQASQAQASGALLRADDGSLYQQQH